MSRRRTNHEHCPLWITGAIEDGAQVSRERLLEEMETDELDALIVGRPADVRFATGARQLWTAGTRPFSPACVIVRSTGRTHVLSVSDDGIPSEVSHAELYGLFWNPANLAAALAAIPGLPEAKRVGTSSSAPGFPKLIGAIAPLAELVDGTGAVWRARAVKTDAEIDLIRQAVSVAEGAMDAMRAALARGADDRHMLGVYLESIALSGTPIPPTERVIRRNDDGSVRLTSGAFVEGYEGAFTRTFPLSGETFDVTVCAPGTTGAQLKAAGLTAFGTGLGAEPPVIAPGVGDDATLVAGGVLNVGDAVHRDLVVIGDAPIVLTNYAGRT